MTESSSRRPRWLTWVVLAIGFAVLAGLIVWAWPWLWEVFHDPRSFRKWLDHFGIWAPLVFVAVQTLQVVVFVLPGEVAQIAGGWLFGFTWGSLLSILGIFFGSWIAFGLARALGVRFVHRIAGPDALAKFDHLMASPKFIGSLFLFFLIPGIPKDILCYVAGLSRIRVGAFLLISTVARLPGIFGSSLMGKAIFHGDWTLLAIVAGFAVLLFGIGWWFREPIFHLVAKLSIDTPEKDPKELPRETGHL